MSAQVDVRELLAAELEASGAHQRASLIRQGHTPGMDAPALRAIAAALSKAYELAAWDRVDASRYRWMRSEGLDRIKWDGWTTETADVGLDYAIDKAMGVP